MKRKYLPIVFGMFLFLLAISLVQAMTVQELINSYSFDYYGEEIGMVNVSDSLTLDKLSFDVSVDGAVAGDYTFYIDLEDAEGLVSGESFGSLNSLGGDVQVNVSTLLLSGASKFNYSLRIYDSDGFLVYKKGDFVTAIYSSYDSGYEVLGVVDSNINNDYIELNVSIYSSIAAMENVSVFLEYGDESFSVSSEENFASGVNYVILKIDSERLKSAHYNGYYGVVGVLIGEKFVVFNYTTSIYNFKDFVKSSYLNNLSSSFVDLDFDGLIDYLEFNFSVESKEFGNYRIEADVYDLFGRYLISVNESSSLDVGTGNIVAKVDGSLLYSLGVDGPYLVDVAQLFLDGVEVDSSAMSYTTEDISYHDFRRPALSDLTISLDTDYNGVDYLVNVTIENIGEAMAFNVYVNLFDSFNYSERVFCNSLNVGDVCVFGFVFDNISSEGLVAIVDFDNFIDEEDEDNNVAFYDGSSLDDDFDGVENSKDRCLTIVGDNPLTLEDEDESGDGCPDLFDGDYLLKECLGYYTGGDADDVNVINNVGSSYFANGRSWFSVDSLFSDDVALIGALSNNPSEGGEMNCFFKLSSVVLSGKTLDVKSNSLKQVGIYSEESDEGELDILREDYNFKFSDGTRVVGKGKYDAKDNISSINIRCVNKFAEKTCRKDCVKDEISRKGFCRDNYFDVFHICHSTQISCFGDCRNGPRDKMRGCMKRCKSEAKECRNNNSVNYKSCIKPLKNDEKVCNNDCSNIYDIDRKYKEEGVTVLTIHDILSKCYSPQSNTKV